MKYIGDLVPAFIDDVTVGDDLLLNSDSGVLSIGADADLKITHDGTNGDFESAGNLTFDVAGDIILDADGADIKFKDDGTEIGSISLTGSNLILSSAVSNEDIIFKGNDGGSTIDALTLDMSDAGTATFNHDIRLGDSSKAVFGAGNDLQIFHDGTNSFVQDAAAGDLILDTNGDSVKITHTDNGETMAQFQKNGFVKLFHNNTTKLETTVAGCTISSSATVSGTNPFVYVQGDGSSYYPYMRVTGLHGGLAIGTYFGGNLTGDTVSFRTGANTADGGTERFRIAANGDLTATDTTIASNSDERLKENIADYSYDIAKFKQYAPKTFDWKNPEAHNGRSGNRGFIAQAVKAIDDKWVGEANVTEENPDYDIISDNVSLTSKLGEKDAMYISIIQQLITKIETLETKVTALEAD